ncbi:MAG: hypothetical protein OJF49_003038 [Ktedonobacterales bacterium]|nr:MAG: hypothetical protein OJF49_003038 [Ktedonobacterales bacterium]
MTTVAARPERLATEDEPRHSCCELPSSPTLPSAILSPRDYLRHFTPKYSTSKVPGCELSARLLRLVRYVIPVACAGAEQTPFGPLFLPPILPLCLVGRTFLSARCTPLPYCTGRGLAPFPHTFPLSSEIFPSYNVSCVAGPTSAWYENYPQSHCTVAYTAVFQGFSLVSLCAGPSGPRLERARCALASAGRDRGLAYPC